MNGLQAYKFSNSALEECPDILNGKTPQEFLKERYQHSCMFGLDKIQRTGMFLYMGWAYDFSDYLKTYVVKQYDRWLEYHAPNKTTLRKSLYGRIQKIVEIS